MTRSEETSVSRSATPDRENQVPCAEVSSTSGKQVQQGCKLRQRSSKRIEEREKRRQNSSRDSRAQKRASSVAAGNRRRVNSKTVQGRSAKVRAAATSDGRSVSTKVKKKERRPTDSPHAKGHPRVSVARKTKHAAGRQKSKGKGSLTKSESNNCEREKTPQSVGQVGIATTTLCNEDIPPLSTAEQTTQMALATEQTYGTEDPAPPNEASDCYFLNMDSTGAFTRKGASPDSTTIVSPTDATAPEETTEEMSVGDSAWNASTDETECAEENWSLTGEEYVTVGQDVFPSALGSPSTGQAQTYEEGNWQVFGAIGNVWWAQPYRSVAQDDSDIFMEPFFSEDFSCNGLDDAVVKPDVDKEAASDPSGVGSEGRQDDGTRTIGGSGGDAASESSTGHVESAFLASPIDAMRAEAPNNASIAQHWLESPLAGPSGHCGIHEAAQPRDQLETAQASDARNSQEDVTDSAMSCGGPQVHPTLGSDSGGDVTHRVD